MLYLYIPRYIHELPIYIRTYMYVYLCKNIINQHAYNHISLWTYLYGIYIDKTLCKLKFIYT